MTTTTAVRFPLEPLLHAAGQSLTMFELPPALFGLNGGTQVCVRDELAALAELVGVSTRLLERRRVSGVDEWEADRWCMLLGVHPCALWDDRLTFDADTAAGQLRQTGGRLTVVDVQ